MGYIHSIQNNRIMKKPIALLIGVLTAITLNAQDVSGTWIGKLTISQGEVRVVFNIESAGSGYSSTLDSPDQNAYGIPVDSTLFKAPVLTIKATALGLVYTATLKDQNTFEGTLTQMGQSMELKMTRQEE